MKVVVFFFKYSYRKRRNSSLFRMTEIYGLILLILLPFIVAQNETGIPNDTVSDGSPGQSKTGSHYEKDGKLYFADLKDRSGNYSLRPYLDDTIKAWALGPYVDIAKMCLLNIIEIDWGMYSTITDISSWNTCYENPNTIPAKSNRITRASKLCFYTRQ